MKKAIFFFYLFVTITAVALGQDHVSSHDFNAIQKYIKENVGILEPIEGVYDVTLNRKIQPLHGNAQSFFYTYKCAIVKTFCLRLILLASL
jgi:hypothetical protein